MLASDHINLADDYFGKGMDVIINGLITSPRGDGNHDSGIRDPPLIRRAACPVGPSNLPLISSKPDLEIRASNRIVQCPCRASNKTVRRPKSLNSWISE